MGSTTKRSLRGVGLASLLYYIYKGNIVNTNNCTSRVFQTRELFEGSVLYSQIFMRLQLLIIFRVKKNIEISISFSSWAVQYCKIIEGVCYGTSLNSKVCSPPYFCAVLLNQRLELVRGVVSVIKSQLKHDTALLVWSNNLEQQLVWTIFIGNR